MPFVKFFLKTFKTYYYGNKRKISVLSEDFQDKIIFVDLEVTLDMGPVTSYLVANKLHCNGGATVRVGMYLKNRLDNGEKMFLIMSGARSSFQMGKLISELIHKGKKDW